MHKDLAKKLLVFAHIPPPHHGQAVMVEYMLRGLKRDPLFEVHHVDARLSDDICDIGGVRAGKVIRLIGYCFDAIRLRIRHGEMDFFYVPAPAKKSAILRDWLVMALVRPWFRRTVFHWHAFGLGHWVSGKDETPSGASGPLKVSPCLFGPFDPFARWLTRRLLGNADLSIVLTNYNRLDAALLNPKQITVVPNGIADSFPEHTIKLARSDRIRIFHQLLQKRPAKGDAPQVVNFLFMGHMIESKGVFVAIMAAKQANSELTKRAASWRVRLSLAGSFTSPHEKSAILSAVEEANLASDTKGPSVELSGFLAGDKKKSALRDADVLLFPTFYEGETQGLVLLEAMSAGLLAISSSWRGVAEVLPEGYPWVVRPKSVEDLVNAMLNCPGSDWADTLRLRYEKNYTVSHHVCAMREALS